VLHEVIEQKTRDIWMQTEKEAHYFTTKHNQETEKNRYVLNYTQLGQQLNATGNQDCTNKQICT
jgi:hypothetical protein